MDLTEALDTTDDEQCPQITCEDSAIPITEFDPSKYEGGLRMPTAGSSEESWFHGAYVVLPVAGLHRNVIYPDLSSLYPNLLRTLNLSPETLVGDADELADSQWSVEDCIWGYYDPRPVKRCAPHEQWGEFTDGSYKAVKAKSSGDWDIKWKDDPQFEKLYFLAHDVAEGFLGGSVDDALAMKEQYRGTPKYGAVKQITNSLYGVVGYSTRHNEFRLFDRRMAEAITLVGRKVIQHSAQTFKERIEVEYGYDAHVVAGDTDSCVLSIPEVDGVEETLDIAFDVAEYVNDGYDAFMEDLCGVRPEHNHMEIEIESYSPKAYFHDRKKRYFTHVTWDDDDGHEADETNVKGFEVVRSDVADVTVEAQQYVVDQLLGEDFETARTNIYEHICTLTEQIESGEYPMSKLGTRRGVQKPLDEYGSASRTPHPAIRGSKYANKHIEGEHIDTGASPMYFPVKRLLDEDLPRTYEADTAEGGEPVDAIAVEHPSNLEGRIELDVDEILQKQVYDRIDPILTNVGMSVTDALTGHSQEDMSSFF